MLRARVLRYCVERPAYLKWAYLKDLLGFVSHVEYPHSWPELHEYLLVLLKGICEAGALTSRTLEDVELILKVLKAEAKKSYFTKKNVFASFIVHILEPVESIAQSLDAKLGSAGGIAHIGKDELTLSCLLDRCRLSCLKIVDNDCLQEYPCA